MFLSFHQVLNNNFPEIFFWNLDICYPKWLDARVLVSKIET